MSGVQSSPPKMPSIGTSFAFFSMAEIPSRVKSVIFASRIIRRSAYSPIHDRIGLVRMCSGWSASSPDAARSARRTSYTGRPPKVAGGNGVVEHHLLGEVAQVRDRAVRERPEPGADLQVGAELLRGPHDLYRLLLAQVQRDAADAGILGAEDELAEVGGAAGDRDVVRKGHAVIRVRVPRGGRPTPTRAAG